MESKTKKQLWFFFAVNILTMSVCFACYSPPPEQDISAKELIGKSKFISMAKVVDAIKLPNGKIKYIFQSERILSGGNVPNFSIVSTLKADISDHHPSGDHSGTGFWDYGGGRLKTYSDCQIYPTFQTGEIYLVFGGDSWSRRSLEHIETIDGRENTKDKWLEFVENELQSRSPE